MNPKDKAKMYWRENEILSSSMKFNIHLMKGLDIALDVSLYRWNNSYYINIFI